VSFAGSAIRRKEHQNNLRMGWTRGGRMLWGSIPWLELMLAASVISLVLQLSWPAIDRWQNRPRAGVQVEQEGRPYNYLLYLPEHYDAAKNWPLLIYLHGSGHRGLNLAKVKDCGPPRLIVEGSRYPMIVVSPLCPDGHPWDPVKVISFLDAVCERFHVDATRVYLTGVSMGGAGTWSTALYAAERFAAIAPLCGSSEPGEATRLSDLPVWAFHGALDEIIPLSESQEMVDAIKAAGGTPKLTVYPSLGHGIWNETYRNPALSQWFLNQRKHAQASQ
jgi:predicted peptidase